MGKKALAVISFGTSHPEARTAIDQIEQTLAAACHTHTLFRAFTSQMIIRKIQRQEGVHVQTPAGLMETLAWEGYDEVICQSLHVMPGNEYEKMCAQIEPFATRFAHFAIGKPLLWQKSDYLKCVRGLLTHMPGLAPDEAFVYMGHGTDHHANAAYALLENTFRFMGAERVYVATVEGFPNFDYILARLHARGVSRVYLAPFMIVAGDHAQNDLAGELEDSWKSRLESAGYRTVTRLKGLGAYEEIADLFAAHLPTGLSAK